MTFAINEIDLSLLKLVKSGRSVKLYYKNDPLQLKTPRVRTPFGVKMYNNSYSSFTDCSIDVSISDQAVSIDLDPYFDAFTARVQALVTESVHYFSTKEPILDIVVSPVFRANKDYPKLMKITMSRDKNGNFDCVLFDQEKNKVILDDSNIETVLSKGKIFAGIIECGKVWYYNGKFGMTWNLMQARFGNAKTVIQVDPVYSQCMIDLDDD